MSIMVESKKNGPDYKGAVAPSVVWDGLIWWDTVNLVHKVYKASTTSWVNFTDMQLVVGLDTYTISGQRGVFSGTSVNSNLCYLTIQTPSNALIFGNPSVVRGVQSSTSNGTTDRGVFAGGSTQGGVFLDVIDYITISSVGNSTPFSTLTLARTNLSGASNGTNNRGIFCGGYTNSYAVTGTVDYITISTLATAIYFGGTGLPAKDVSSCSNGTNNRGLIVGGTDSGGSRTTSILYLTITTLGNGTAFGTLPQSKGGCSSTSNGTNNRGLTFGGYNQAGSDTSSIEYTTITTLGNATNFGSLLAPKSMAASTSNGVSNRGVIGHGTNVEYLDILVLSNSITFGTLLNTRTEIAACSNA